MEYNREVFEIRKTLPIIIQRLGRIRKKNPKRSIYLEL